MNEVRVKAIFLLADIEILKLTQIPDQYAGRKDLPWWIVETPHGTIEIGWRKRVIHIDWANTGVVYPLRTIHEGYEKYQSSIHLMKADTTKWETGCHAYGYGEAVNVLLGIRDAISTVSYHNEHWAEHPPKPEDMENWIVAAHQKNWIAEGEKHIERIILAVNKTHALEQFHKAEKNYSVDYCFLHAEILADRAKRPELYPGL